MANGFSGLIGGKYLIIKTILRRMAFGGMGREVAFWGAKRSETADPQAGEGGSPARLTLSGRPSPPRRLQHSAARRRAARIAARTRVGWGGEDTRGPRGAPAPTAKKAHSGGPRPDSCSGEAAAGNTKRLIQQRSGGREERGGIEEKIEGGEKQKGKKKKKGNVQNPGGIGAERARRSAPRTAARGSVTGTAPDSPCRPGWGSARLGLLFSPWSLFRSSPRHRERLKPRQSK